MAGLSHLQIPQRFQIDSVMHDDIVFLDAPSTSSPHYRNKPYLPHDVDSHLDGDSVWEDDDDLHTALPDSLDSMVLNIGFDCSCLDNLDEKLLSSPIDSFADICWASAVNDDRFARPPRRRSAQSNPNLGLTHSSSESESDDDSRTCHGSPTFSTFGKAGDSSAVIASMHTHATPRNRSFHSAGGHFDDDGQKSFIWADPHFGTSDPKDSIGFFPIPSTASRQNLTRKSASRGIERIMTICTNLIKLPS